MDEKLDCNTLLTSTSGPWDLILGTQPEISGWDRPQFYMILKRANLWIPKRPFKPTRSHCLLREISHLEHLRPLRYSMGQPIEVTQPILSNVGFLYISHMAQFLVTDMIYWKTITRPNVRYLWMPTKPYLDHLRFFKPLLTSEEG